MMPDMLDKVRRRSYEIWESEGRPDGEDQRHWSQASDELCANSAAGSIKKNTRNKAVPSKDASEKAERQLAEQSATEI